MNQFDRGQYGPFFGSVFPNDLCRPLGPAAPDEAIRRQLNTMGEETAFQHTPIGDPEMAALCCAAVWLAHDFLDECHAICQSVETPAGSYWHGIMHRREGDYSNAKYWFRRTGDHPVFAPLAVATRALADALDQDMARSALPEDRWDPFSFVDLCQAAQDSSATTRNDFCRQTQQREWELLFDDCYRKAVHS